MKIISLASGSKGNAYLAGSEGRWLLIDAGPNYKTLSARLAEAGVKLAEIVGILITHEHTDHVGGLKTLLNHLSAPVYANAMTAEATVAVTKADESAFVCFENGQSFETERGAFRVHPFSIPHDTCDPVGYLVSDGSETYFHGTDIGTPLASVGLKFAEADVATLESNHDLPLLRASGRPPSLIQRIAGPRGHLSNDASAEIVRRYAAPRLKRLALAHLSRDCNAPHLAEHACREALAARGRADVALAILEQDRVTRY